MILKNKFKKKYKNNLIKIKKKEKISINNKFLNQKKILIKIFKQIIQKIINQILKFIN